MMEILIIILFFVSIFGYGANIVKVFANDNTFTGRDAVRIAGVFIFPVGAVIGYFGDV